VRRLCQRLRTRSGRDWNSGDFHRLRLKASLGRNRRRDYRGRRWCRHGNRCCWFFQYHGLTNRRRHNCRRSCRPSLLGGDPHCWNGSSRRWSSLRSVNYLSTAPVLHHLQLTCKVGNFVGEFGDLTAATVVGNQRHNDGWRAHHHPPKQEKRYEFHRLARQVFGNLRCILERFCGKVLRYFC
jgi:hypothetical protein